MGYVRLCLILLLSACLSACTQAAVSPGAPTLQTTAPRKSGTLRFGTFSTPNASSMSWLMALEMLKAEGYTVEETVFASSDATIEALARGAVDIVGVSVASWAAIPKGAQISTIVAHNANPFSIVATQDIASCSDLNGRSLAVGSPGTINSLLVEIYLEANCAGSSPTLVTISDSQARRAALLAGQVDATTMELADMQQLSAEAPGRFRTLVEFSKAFPRLNFTVALANVSFANAHPDILKDYVRSILTVNRAVRANPQQLRDAMIKHLNYTPEQAQATSNAYLAADIWDSNGGLSTESITTTLEFLAAHGLLPTDLKVEDVADLSYLNTVLDEIGRK